MCDEMGGEAMDVSSDVTEPTDDIPADVPDDIPEDMPDGIPEDNLEEAPDDIPEDVPEDIPEDFPKDIPGDIPEDMPDDIPEDNPADVPEDISEEPVDDDLYDVSEEIPEDIAEESFEETVDTTEEIPGDTEAELETTSDNIEEPVDTPEEVPEEFSGADETVDEQPMETVEDNAEVEEPIDEQSETPEENAKTNEPIDEQPSKELAEESFEETVDTTEEIPEDTETESEIADDNAEEPMGTPEEVKEETSNAYETADEQPMETAEEGKETEETTDEQPSEELTEEPVEDTAESTKEIPEDTEAESEAGEDNIAETLDTSEEVPEEFSDVDETVDEQPMETVEDNTEAKKPIDEQTEILEENAETNESIDERLSEELTEESVDTPEEALDGKDITDEQLIDATTENNDAEEYSNLDDLHDKEYFGNAKSSYDTAEDKADSSDLRYYKAHDLDGHIKKVVEKSAEAAEILEISEGVNLDKKDIAIASLYHDTGMDGGDKYSAEEGNNIRKNHPMTSAIHVLENRDSIVKDGGNPDQIAALSLLHSKSCSGVTDLSNDVKIEEAFEKLSKEVATYNATHDEQIVFNPESIDIDKFKYNATALRLGDSFGHDSSESKTQSGGFMDITYNTIQPLQLEEWKGDENWKAEIMGSSITYHSPLGDTQVIDDEFDSKGFTRMYQFGEGNISEMGSKIGEDGEYNAYFNINSSNAQNCTLKCISERLEEIKTADRLLKGRHSVDINLPERCDDATVKLYESFAKENADEYGKIRINIGGTR